MQFTDIIGWIKVFFYSICCKCICIRRCCCKSTNKSKPSKHRIDLKALILGLPKSGKTTFVANFLTLTQQNSKPMDSNSTSQPFPKLRCVPSYIPTSGCLVHNEAWYREFKLTMVEVGGKFQKYWKRYTKGCHGLIYVVNGNDNIKESIDALESFVVGNDAVRHWPILICKHFTDQDVDGGDGMLKELEEHCQKRHMLNAWVDNIFISKTSSYSSMYYSSGKAEEELRKAMDFLVVGACNYRLEQVAMEEVAEV